MTVHFVPYRLQAEAKGHFPQRPQRESQCIMQALGIAMFACLTMSWANANQQETDVELHRPALETPATNRNTSVVDLSLAPITIEGERLYPEPTLDESRRKFRDALGTPPIFIASERDEREFTDGSMELTTRFGRFCAKPLPGYLQPRIGGNITLAARCAAY